MREILFRGKRKDNDEWVYGDLLQTIYPSGKPCYCSIMEQKPTAINYPVIPETVGQYTGLTDKNSKKIFEGDIVLFPWVTYGEEEAFFIEFKDGVFLASPLKDNEPKIWSITIEGNNFDFEIISNIHDNPELLERRENGT